jgi:hypothetical protein
MLFLSQTSNTVEENIMSKTQRFTMEQILAVQKKLRGLPPKRDGKTREEAFEFLAADIRKAMKKGHGLEDVRDILAGEGVHAPLSRMKALMTKADGDKEQDHKTGNGMEEESAAAFAPVQAEKKDTGLFTMKRTLDEL